MQQSNNKLSVLVEPTLEEAKSLIEKAFVQRRTLIVTGNCKVDYVGRASSKLELGERFLIIKSDGSLLIHRPVGYEPVNWQPSGSVFHTQIKEDTLEVYAVRQKPKENVNVQFTKIYTVTAIMLVDAGEFILNASEEDMHKAILFKPELIEEGFKPISWEKKVEPGFVDVYGMDKNGQLVVIEVKRKTATKEAVLQLFRYIEAIKLKADRPIRGILVAPGLGKDVQALLVSMGLEFKELYPKKCAEILKKSGPTFKLETFFNNTTNSQYCDGS
ncbi:MAG: endonuclease NucS [Candidatus Bathyarchaeota archaeon]|uniref:endonuclease NucS n=1 Tax=Candidatus Bathycorpusculum sp. TaxID=2994959 RepID=UPI0028354FF6|nr:endonuclease NucS [Candidatus Termiticorpusculum sp.]MCL2257747.1 endonuclease NucS [Candidatus Termiticorpusculum sp.]MCL2291973.1 endonuclease NucS [Candidatus Termiticorpusculum sp.]